MKRFTKGGQDFTLGDRDFFCRASDSLKAKKWAQGLPWGGLSQLWRIPKKSQSLESFKNLRFLDYYWIHHFHFPQTATGKSMNEVANFWCKPPSRKHIFKDTWSLQVAQQVERSYITLGQLLLRQILSACWTFFSVWLSCLIINGCLQLLPKQAMLSHKTLLYTCSVFSCLSSLEIAFPL